MTNELIMTDKTVRIKGVRWEAIEKLTWGFMEKDKRFIKPTDVLDALLIKALKDFKQEDFNEAMKER
jgi:hypothetical protein